MQLPEGLQHGLNVVRFRDEMIVIRNCSAEGYEWSAWRDDGGGARFPVAAGSVLANDTWNISGTLFRRSRVSPDSASRNDPPRLKPQLDHAIRSLITFVPGLVMLVKRWFAPWNG